MYNLLIYLHIICMYTMHMFYITQRICIYNSWFVCVFMCACVIFFMVRLELQVWGLYFCNSHHSQHIKPRVHTLSAWLNWWCKPWPPADVISDFSTAKSLFPFTYSAFRRWSWVQPTLRKGIRGKENWVFYLLKRSVYENLQHSLGQGDLSLLHIYFIYSIIYISKNSWIFILCFMQGHIILLLRLFQVWQLVWLFQVSTIIPFQLIPVSLWHTPFF